MKKFWNIMLAVLMLVGAVACTEGNEATDGTGNNNENGGTNNGAGVSFTAVVKGSEAAADIWANAWRGNETINVEAEGKVFAFTNSEADKSRFTCTAEGVEAIVGKSVVVKVDDSDMSKMGTAGIAAESTIKSFDPAKGVELTAQNALLQYTLTGKGKVTFEMDYLAFRHNGGNNASISFMDVEGKNYVSFLPGTKSEAELNISVDGTLWSTKTLTPAAGNVYDLGTLQKGDNGDVEGGGNEDDPTAEGMVYLVPNVWDADGAWFVAYYFNSAGENAAVTLTKNSEGAYEGAVPAGMEGMLFVRMNPAYTEFAWNDETVTDRVWSQTADLLIGVAPNNYYYVTDWTTGVWGTADGYDDSGNEGGGDIVVAANVYLAPGVWNVSGAWYVAHFFGTDGYADVTLTDADGDNIYEGSVPAGMDKVLFCRMNPAYTEFGWNDDTVTDRVWNQTGDLIIPVEPNNYYCITGWEQTEGKWGTKEEAESNNNGGSTGGNEGGNTGVASNVGLVGSFQGWDVAAPVAMVESTDGWVVATDVELYKSDEFKFVEGNSWKNPSYGNPTAVLVAEVDTEYTLTTEGGQDIKASKNGKFDIYFNTVSKAFKYTCTEEYTGITVDIIFDNKANWSPLYVTLKSGETIVADNATVTDNKYTVSGEYIGQTLTYVVSNGTKSLEGNVTIAKSGATISVDEVIIKLTFVADTDNTKQWFANAHIHVWGTGSAIDSPGWPGIAMTDNGDKTWSINVPSELVGKTITYVVNNGGDWKSNDSTVTIKAEGNTINLSSIGIS
ncbi:MAG: hypothetical protein IJX40_04665 [Alistipes sp.]|nr:hypothetical protein [Alistipes sp.]